MKYLKKYLNKLLIQAFAKAMLLTLFGWVVTYIGALLTYVLLIKYGLISTNVDHEIIFAYVWLGFMVVASVIVWFRIPKEMRTSRKRPRLPK